MNFTNNEISQSCLYNVVKSWKMFRENIDAMRLLGIVFLSYFDLDDDPTENDPDEKPNKEKRLANTFRQPVSKLYAMFVQSVIPILDTFNTFLEAEEPLIHILYDSTFCVCIVHYF